MNFNLLCIFSKIFCIFNFSRFSNPSARIWPLFMREEASPKVFNMAAQSAGKNLVYVLRVLGFCYLFGGEL